MTRQKFRLTTRNDFDGMVCAMLLRDLGLIGDEIRFVHPKDVQDGVVRLTAHDITTNLPYHPEAHLAFDHHASELIRVAGRPENHIIRGDAPSTARVVYDHYGGQAAFPHFPPDLLAAVDKADSARFTIEEVLAPSGWVLLSFLTDPRTGLERSSEFGVGNADLMMELIRCGKDHDVDELLALPDVRERSDAYFWQTPLAYGQLFDCTRFYRNLAVLDLRNEDPIWATNRFMLYALFPDVTASIHVLWGLYRARTVFAGGKSIFKRGNTTHIGKLMLEFGGGGHEAAGSCQVINDKAERVLDTLIERIYVNG